MTIDSAGWTRFDQSANAEFFEVEPGVLAVVPHDGTNDDETTARQSVAAQLKYLRGKAMRAGVLVFVDRVANQDSRAREVYRVEPDPAFQVCFALVGGTAFGRAVGSFFIGLHPPRVPTRMFATLDEALAWVRSMVKA